jgi:hypothetical protein
LIGHRQNECARKKLFCYTKSNSDPMIDKVDYGVYSFLILMSVVLIFVVYNVWKKRLKLTFGFIIFLLLFFGVPTTVIVKIQYGKERHYIRYKEYFKNFNISFVGKVNRMHLYESNPGIQPGAGPKFNVYYLRILKSSVKNYDPSDTTDNFYCVIRDSAAILIEETIHDSILVGDLLYYNGKVDTMYHYIIKQRKIIKSGREIWLDKYDTILYERWRPAHILNDPHRRYIFDEFEKIKITLKKDNL